MNTLELHIVSSHSPNNINRDDTGSPKDVVFGGVRRARISSQSLKRAGRLYFRDSKVVQPNELGERTKRMADEVARQLVKKGRNQPEAQAAAEIAVTTLMNGRTEYRDVQDGADTLMTTYLMFVSRLEINGMVDIIHEHWDDIVAQLQAVQPEEGQPAKGRKKAKAGDKAKEEDAEKVLPKLQPGSAANKAIGQLLQNRKLLSADVAMFGRMVATNHSYSVDAAVQVAHALGTHALKERQFDFYTAVDDLKPDDVAGADMMGTVEFTASVMYRYVNVNLDQLVSNLDGNVDLAARSVQALIEATVYALPTGKQNTFAAHNMPSLIAAEVRPTGAPRNLANAFVRPVTPGPDNDLVAESSDRLMREWRRQGRIFGHTGKAHLVNAHDRELSDDVLPVGTRSHESVSDMVQKVMEDVRAQLKPQEE